MLGLGNQESENAKGNDWEGIWSKTTTPPFHIGSTNADLLKHEHHLILSEKCRIFVPLCGKTLDMAYLLNKGHTIVGCELSEIAIQQFYKEHSIKYSTMTHPTAQVTIYKGIDENITIYKGDLFLLNSAIIGKFDAIWDRGSFIAIKVDQQSEYAKLMQDLLAPGGRYLLNSYVYEDYPHLLAPHSITDEEIQSMFGSFCNISILDKRNDVGDEGDKMLLRRLGVDFITITNSLLTLK